MEVVIDVNDPNLLSKAKEQGKVGRTVNRASSFFFCDVNPLECPELPDSLSVSTVAPLESRLKLATTSGRAHFFITSLAIVYVVLSVGEILLFMANLDHVGHVPYAAIRGIMISSILLMSVFILDLFIKAAVGGTGFLAHFAKVRNAVDLMLLLASVAVETFAIFDIRRFPPIIVAVLLLRVYGAFRIIAMFNKTIISRENVLVSRRRKLRDSLNTEFEAILNQGGSLSSEIARTNRQSERATFELKDVNDSILRIKRTSWSAIVPEYMATNIAVSNRSSWVPAGSARSKRSVNSLASKNSLASAATIRVSALKRSSSEGTSEISFYDDAVSQQFGPPSPVESLSNLANSLLQQLDVSKAKKARRYSASFGL